MELRWNVRESRALTEAQRARLLDRLGSRTTDDGVLILRSAEQRSQHQNRAAAIARLQALVSEAIQPPKVRRPTRRTRGSKERRLQAKKRRGEVKKLRKPPQV